MNIPPPLGPSASLRWSIVRSVLDQLKPRRTLEIGCGQGSFGARISGMTDYIGVEPDEQSYTTAKSRVIPAGGRIMHGTINLLDPAERFDVVCAFEVLEHIEDDRRALSDWVERVAPGGAIVLSVPAWPERFGPSDELVGHYRRYRPEDVADLFRELGYSEVEHVLYGWPLGFLTDAIRNRVAARRLLETSSTMADRTAGSGRWLQPSGPLTGLALRAGTAPFALLQKLRPERGTGLVSIGRVANGPGGLT